MVLPTTWRTVMSPVAWTFRRPRGSFTVIVTSPLARMSGTAPVNSTSPATVSASAASAIGLKGSGALSGASTSGVFSPKFTSPVSISRPTVRMSMLGAVEPTTVSTLIGRSARSA